MPRVAVSSVAVLRHVYGHPGLKEYEDLIPEVFAEAESARGFIARARPADDCDEKSNFDREWGVWGRFCAPRFYTGGTTYETDQRASILALFTDLVSLHEFTFTRLHRYVLKNRRNWIVEPAWRTYAIWWVGDDEVPTWEAACGRIDHINEYGPTPYAFDFHHPHDASGNPITIASLSGAVEADL